MFHLVIFKRNIKLFLKKNLRVLKNEFYLLHSKLKSVLNCIDFTHVCFLFLSDSVILKSHVSIYQKKFNVLFKNHHLKHNPDGVSDVEKLLLVKGLWFSLPPKKFNYADYLTNFELFSRSIWNLEILSN